MVTQRFNANSPLGRLSRVGHASPLSANPSASERGLRRSGVLQGALGSEMDLVGLTAEQAGRARAIFAEPYEYVEHPLFELDADEAEHQIFVDVADVPQPNTSWYHPAMTWTDEPRLGKRLNKTMTAAEERIIFAQFNYCRLRVHQLRSEMLNEPQPDLDLVREMLDWDARAEAYRVQIAGLNLALVLAMSKRLRGADVDYGEMISEGNMALMRSIDKFDISRGFKFSTYACRAILKAFSRTGEKHTKYKQTFVVDFDPKFERSNWQETKNEQHEQDCVSELRTILKSNRAELSEVERKVVEKRFAIGESAGVDANGEPRPLTLEQVGRSIGVTKERVRQIQETAMSKLRDSMESGFLRRA